MLYVPDFRFNPLSISALTQSCNYSVTFLSDCCFIQDLSQAKMIGMGRRHGNLYVLDTSSFSLSSNFNQQSICIGNFCNSVSLSQKNLWHCRLGHPSFVQIQSLRNRLNLKQGYDFDSLNTLIVLLVIMKSNAFYHLLPLII